LKQAEPLKLKASTKKVKTLNTVTSYMEVQVPRNIALYHDLYGTAKLMQLVTEGKDRYKTDDRRILEDNIRITGGSHL